MLLGLNIWLVISEIENDLNWALSREYSGANPDFGG